MADETKITLKMGVIAAGIASLIVMICGAIMNHHGRLAVIETNYTHVATTLSKIDMTVDEIRRDQLRLKGIEKGER